jgi:hypothetical protein
MIHKPDELLVGRRCHKQDTWVTAKYALYRFLHLWVEVHRIQNADFWV